MEALLGTKSLINVKGETICVDEALKEKDVLGLYFSASWCGPCQGFTPQLSTFYKAYSENKKFEIVFVSSDKDEVQFVEYFKKMPWLALPFENRQAKKNLSKKYKVKGIPTLILLDAKSGEIITVNGRDGVISNDVDAFPWKTKTVSEILAGIQTLDTKDGPQPFAQIIKPTSNLLLYFSAHWCPPCRNFTPVLSQWYEENKTTKDLEIIFCSSDRDQEAFNEYYNKFMPSWTALPFNDKTTKDALSQAFEIRGIPSLIALGPTQPDGSRPIISKDGRTCVSNNQPFPQAWLPQPFADLSVAVDCKESDINETTSLLLLLDHVTDTSAQQHAVQTAKDFAQRHANNPDILVFFSTKNEGPAMRLRQLLKSARNDPVKAFLIKLDLPDDGAFYMSTEFLASDLSLDNIQSFFDNPGERYQIKG